MKCYDSMDLISDLQTLVEKNVKHYQSDFSYDKEVLFDSLHETERDFIWFTRENGTGLVREKEAYMQGAYGNLECMTYLPDKSTEAYYVHIDGIFNGKLIGRYYPVEKDALLTEIVKNTVPIHEVRVSPKEGEAFTVPYKTYIHEAASYSRKYGEFKKTYLLQGDDAKTIANVLLKHKTDRENARSEAIMNEPKMFYYDTSYGDREKVFFEMNMYLDNNNLFLGLNYFDKEEDAWDYYGDITVNITDLPYLHSTLDTNNNNAEHLLAFLKANEIGELTGQYISSGYCRFPVYKFNEEKLKELCPEEFFEYQKAHGRGSSLNEKLAEAKEIKESLEITKDKGASLSALER